MCGLLKMICVLACLLVIPATTQAQQVGTKGSKAKCKKPAVRIFTTCELIILFLLQRDWRGPPTMKVAPNSPAQKPKEN